MGFGKQGSAFDWLYDSEAEDLIGFKQMGFTVHYGMQETETTKESCAILKDLLKERIDC